MRPNVIGGAHETSRGEQLFFHRTNESTPSPDLQSCDWLYELKFGGYRALAFKAGKEVRLVSRNQINFGNHYPQLIDSSRLLTAKNVIIDGDDRCALSEREIFVSAPAIVRHP
jgi:ATP-dependent DNA ligase